MRTSIDAQWAVDGVPLDERQTGVITQHVIGESINWSPLARLYLHTDVSYVLNQTNTPASSIDLNPNTSPTVVDFRNDYWTFTAGCGYIMNDKTDLQAEYIFYRANDYFNNSLVAVPYGMGATEHTVSATLTRQLTKQVRLRLSYTYFDYTDETSGGHNNYRAHSVSSSLQFRF
jgi:predicted porin